MKKENIKDFLSKLEKELELKKNSLSPDLNLAESVFWDSLVTMNLVFYFDSEYSIEVDPENISKFKTPKDIYNFVVKSSKKK
tara:strand:- start:276 stop:521 length:246 start_codon:yes stop_codon:yes gene_type:complete